MTLRPGFFSKAVLSFFYTMKYYTTSVLAALVGSSQALSLFRGPSYQVLPRKASSIHHSFSTDITSTDSSIPTSIVSATDDTGSLPTATDDWGSFPTDDGSASTDIDDGSYPTATDDWGAYPTGIDDPDSDDSGSGDWDNDDSESDDSGTDEWASLLTGIDVRAIPTPTSMPGSFPTDSLDFSIPTGVPTGFTGGGGEGSFPTGTPTGFPGGEEGGFPTGTPTGLPTGFPGGDGSGTDSFAIPTPTGAGPSGGFGGFGGGGSFSWPTAWPTNWPTNWPTARPTGAHHSGGFGGFGGGKSFAWPTGLSAPTGAPGFGSGTRTVGGGWFGNGGASGAASRTHKPKPTTTAQASATLDARQEQATALPPSAPTFAAVQPSGQEGMGPGAATGSHLSHLQPPRTSTSTTSLPTDVIDKRQEPTALTTSLAQITGEPEPSPTTGSGDGHKSRHHSRSRGPRPSGRPTGSRPTGARPTFGGQPGATGGFSHHPGGPSKTGELSIPLPTTFQTHTKSALPSA
jgi:hypothetical protein